jgi:hypothetical protein
VACRNITARERVGDDVLAAWFVFHGEVKTQELAHPMMMQYYGKALVQQKLEAVVVHFDDEYAPPEVRPPVTLGLNQTNELPLVSG